jgi:hypothetical protein
MRTTHRLTIVLAVLVLAASSARADQWNDRTVLMFSSPVMIPGATLPAGTYVFELADSKANRDLVRVRREGDNSIVATAQAVPIRRAEVNDNVVVQFNPTDAGAAPAIKAWFYPASRYGHEFLYPEEQARHIAERTKTIVLAVDVPGSDLNKGVLHTFDAAGERREWRNDAETMREHEAWQRSRSAADRDERQQASAPLVRSNFKGARVELDELEENPSKYIGQAISVDGEVEEIYGPRLFTIDEPHWGDLDGEVLVLLPTPLAALVKDDDRVTISGTMKPFVRAEIEREWGWLGLDPSLDIEVTSKPVLVAERLIGGDDNVALVIDTTAHRDRAVGTSGSNAAAVTDAHTIATGDEALVGRQTRLNDVRVTGTASSAGGGFFVSSGGTQVYVLPAQAGTSVASGDSVSIEGVVLQMPRGMAGRLNAPGTLNTDVYVYATDIER